MGIPTNIHTLLSGEVVEWARIEFKETWDAEASLKTICAFANDIDNWGGGYLVIGVKEENGRPLLPPQGVPAEKVDAILKDMLNKCKRIQPEYIPIVEVVDYNGKKIISWLQADSYDVPSKRINCRRSSSTARLEQARRRLPASSPTRQRVNSSH